MQTGERAAAGRYIRAAVGAALSTTLIAAYTASAQTRDAVRLESLTPAATGYGMVDNSPEPWKLARGSNILDQSQYGIPRGSHWPNAMKVIASYGEDFALPEGTAYRSRMTNLFAVEGSLLTGVGLWAPTVCSYHWIEYAIPAGATRFKGSLYITDDVHGVCFHADLAMNNWVALAVTADGQKVYESGCQRWSQADGSGQKIGDFEFKLPPGAKRLRFRVESIAVDNNVNTELVVHEGRFVP